MPREKAILVSPHRPTSDYPLDWCFVPGFGYTYRFGTEVFCFLPETDTPSGSRIRDTLQGYIGFGWATFEELRV